MLKTIDGVYRNGKIELAEKPEDMEGAPVKVTFLPLQGPIDLRALEISKEEAAELRGSFGLAAEDWDRPEMDIYDEL